MKKMRHFLDNPKKVMLAAGCTAAILSVGGISTVYASGVLAQSSGCLLYTSDAADEL